MSCTHGLLLFLKKTPNAFASAMLRAPVSFVGSFSLWSTALFKTLTHQGLRRASHSSQVLSEKEKVVSQQVGVLEKKKGVSGFIETAESLEKVSAAKGEIDEAKGQTLEEISKFVTEINQVIKERKSKLAPQIKDLRAVRQKFQVGWGVRLCAKHTHFAFGVVQVQQKRGSSMRCWVRVGAHCYFLV